MKKAQYRRSALVGTGGMRCLCCVSKGMKWTVKRIGKRRFNQELTRQLVQEEKESVCGFTPAGSTS